MKRLKLLLLGLLVSIATFSQVAQHRHRTGVLIGPYASPVIVPIDSVSYNAVLGDTIMWSGGAMLSRSYGTRKFTSTTLGLVPASAGGTANFLRADGTFAIPPGVGGAFITLTDVDPANYAGSGGYIVMVNATPDGLEFVSPATYAITNFALQTTLLGYTISDSKANFNTALSDGVFIFASDTAAMLLPYAQLDEAILPADTAAMLTPYSLLSEIDHDAIINTHNLTTDIDHDAITNYDANKHFDHTGISILTSATSGLSGGGTIGANRSPLLDLSRLTAVATLTGVDQLGAYIDGTGQRKITYTNLLSELNADLTIAATFPGLTDVPAYAGHALDVVTVVAGEDAVEYTDAVDMEDAAGVMIVSVDTVLYTNTAQTPILVLPAGAVIWRVGVAVVTGFTGTDTDLLDIGITTEGNRYQDDLSIANNTPIMKLISNPLSLGDYISAETTVSYQYFDANADAGAGEAYIYVHYSLP